MGQCHRLPHHAHQRAHANLAACFLLHPPFPPAQHEPHRAKDDAPQYTGLTNMDSGDARGDAYFGLSQLVLPQLCALEPSFLWCANRQYLSDGAAHMVYTEFDRSRAAQRSATTRPATRTRPPACSSASS